MAAHGSDVPAWMQESSLPSAEDVRLDQAIEQSGFTSDHRSLRDYSVGRGRCRRFGIPCLGCLALAAVVAGISMAVTGKGPAELAGEAEDLAEEYLPGFGGGGGGGEEDDIGDPFGDDGTGGGFGLISFAFGDGDPIPAKYTISDGNVSPPLRWSDPPEGTQSLLLIFDEPSDESDGEPRTHWILYGISPETSSLPEDLHKTWEVEISTEGGDSYRARQGLNSRGEDILSHGADADPLAAGGVGYYGPTPQAGSGVRLFYFRLYALKGNIGDDDDAVFEEGPNREAILEKAEGVGVLETATLQVSYQG